MTGPTTLGSLIEERIKLLGYTSVGDFERRHHYADKTVKNIVKGKTKRPTTLILNQIAVHLRMVPRELHIAAGYTDEDPGPDSAFGYDQGTQETLVKRLLLAKGADPERASFPLGLMHDRGLITIQELRAGLRYGLLHGVLYGRSVPHTALSHLVVSEGDAEERKGPRLPSEIEQQIMLREATEMVTALDPMIRAVCDPVILEDKFPQALLDAKDWAAPLVDGEGRPYELGGARSLKELHGQTEEHYLKSELSKGIIVNLPPRHRINELRILGAGLLHMVEVADRFHAARLKLFEDYRSEEHPLEGRNVQRAGSF